MITFYRDKTPRKRNSEYWLDNKKRVYYFPGENTYTLSTDTELPHIGYTATYDNNSCVVITFDYDKNQYTITDGKKRYDLPVELIRKL